MKTTVRMIAGGMAVALGLWSGIAWAGPLLGPLDVLASLSAVAAANDPGSARTEDKKSQAADLIARARQAMAENNLSAAESLISQAESLGVSYGPLSLGDPIKKARGDLEQKKKAGQSAPARPSQLFSPFGLGKSNKVPSSDPFARRSATAGPESPAASATISDNPAVTPLPRVDTGSPVRALPPDDATTPPFGRAAITSPAEEARSALPAALLRSSAVPPAAGNASVGDAPGRSGSQELLRAARKALAVGDVRTATTLVQQARAAGGRYDPLDDTPDRVEALMRKWQDVASQPRNSEAVRRAYARVMLEQAQGLLRSGDYEEAEHLATQAARENLTYSPYESKPQDILNQIDAARRGRRPAVSLPGVGAGAASSLPPGPQREAVEWVAQARAALAAGQLTLAESLARRAEMLRLPDAAYGPPENRPGQVLLEIRQARQHEGSRVVPAGATYPVTPATGSAEMDRTASRAVYDPGNDPTRNVPAANYQAFPPFARPYDVAQTGPMPPTPPTPAPPDASPSPTPPSAANVNRMPGESLGMALFRQGEEALKAHNAERAYQFYRQAADYMRELDPVTADRLKERLQLLSVPSRTSPGTGAGRSPVDETASKQDLLARQVAAELIQQETKARQLRERDPNGALQLLEECRKRVEAAGLEPGARDRLLRNVDRAVADTQQFIEQNRPRIELDQRNKQVHDEIAREQRTKVEIDAKVAEKVNQCNRLMEEQRFEEAEVLAKQVAEMDPRNPVAQQLLWQTKFLRRYMNNEAVKAEKEQGFWQQLANVDKASAGFDDNRPYQHGNVKEWQELTKTRSKWLAQQRGRHRSERELEIEKKLRTPVSPQFQNQPLSKVLDYLSTVSEVNLFLDPQGMEQEGARTDTPVTIEVRHEITLRSALNLILKPLHLNYVIQDEVLKITSEQLREGQVYTVTYPVADLVVPIPHFVPSPRMGLAGAYHDALGNVGFGGANGFGTTPTPLAVVASKDGARGSAAINPAVMAQMAGAHPGLMGANLPLGFGPGGLGGGAQADFDPLIELITTSIQPNSWDAVGGPGTVGSFETNLSIVVSQTQEVHDQIVDLLEQLRRLQDLQVTIEVRFITLNDNFFERIGVDFDFDIDDNIDSRPGVSFGRIMGPPQTQQGEPLRDFRDRDDDKNITVGIQGPTDTGPLFSADLDIPVRQGSYGLATPQFGGFQAGAGATLGFAILSDIEAWFFIEAAQGDSRTNVLQAPKVTLFNGQQAFVSDTSQTPFVISVIPVVGDFAAAQQPVIVVLSEGTCMTVQAVVSNDRRFVRLTLVPFFSKIGDNVPTFTFTGSETTTTDTSAEGWVNSGNPNDSRRTNNRGNATTTRQGTTVQLPTFSFVTVTTTVSVPDGGTVLLGGVKRLREGRREFGVPILNKLPYLNRLFKNVGIGRETQSLMMMVTPRIIIQEEEEEKLGVLPPS